jgi:hypothetical protein
MIDDSFLNAADVVLDGYRVARSVLGVDLMSRTALAIVMVTASASTASAGGFVGLGIGTGAASSGDVAFVEDGRSGRLMLGYRFGRISIEGMGTRYDMMTPDAHTWQGTTLAVAGKYNFPLGDSFEVFGRLGLQRTDINDDNYPAENSGNGYLVGAGVEFRLPVAVTALSVFIDYNIQHTSLSNTSYMDLGLTTRIWTLGGVASF